MENKDEHIHTNKTNQKKEKKTNKESRNPIQDRGRKGATVDPKGSVASPKRDREPMEEMTGGFLRGKPQALTHPILAMVSAAKELKPPKASKVIGIKVIPAD